MDKKDMPLVVVVIVTWNNSKDIKDCLDSITKQDYDNYKVVLIDNDSSDNTVEIIKTHFPSIDLIQLEKNIYLVGGNNYGIKYSIEKYSPEYILVLNPDTQSQTNLISELLNSAKKDPKIGAVGPKVKFQKSKNEGLINTAGLIYDDFDQAYDIGFMEEDKGQYDEEREVFGVSGVCVLYRTAMLKEIGLYWNMIKLYLDEVELFIRAHKKGWKVIYTPKTTLGHSYMQSIDNNKNYEANREKKKVWLFIALRHYSIIRKLAMIKKFFLNQ